MYISYFIAAVTELWYSVGKLLCFTDDHFKANNGDWTRTMKYELLVCG